jgi:hypothetical protein
VHGYAPTGYGGSAPSGAPAETSMLKLALGRAFRLRIEPNELLPSEAHALASASPSISEPHLQAFLAWRRSVLFLVALALVPVTLMRLVEAFGDDTPAQLRFILVIPAVVEALLCLVCWYQLRHWMDWRRQRRALFRAWLLFMAAPFAVFLIPMDSIVDDMVRAQLGEGMAYEAGAMGAQAAGVATALKVAISLYALIILAPKAVSLIAGTIRAGIVTKLLFPGTAGPGWLVGLATPLYALFVFTLLIVPYQITGSGWYFGAVAAIVVAQVVNGRMGYALARPTTHVEAVQIVARARSSYLVAMVVFAVCMITALGSLTEQLGALTIITTALSFAANVLLLTLIGSDLVITSLARARGLTSGAAQQIEESNQQLTAFVGET